MTLLTPESVEGSVSFSSPAEALTGIAMSSVITARPGRESSAENCPGSFESEASDSGLPSSFAPRTKSPAGIGTRTQLFFSTSTLSVATVFVLFSSGGLGRQKLQALDSLPFCVPRTRSFHLTCASGTPYNRLPSRNGRPSAVASGCTNAHLSFSKTPLLAHDSPPRRQRGRESGQPAKTRALPGARFFQRRLSPARKPQPPARRNDRAHFRRRPFLRGMLQRGVGGQGRLEARRRSGARIGAVCSASRRFPRLVQFFEFKLFFLTESPLLQFSVAGRPLRNVPLVSILPFLSVPCRLIEAIRSPSGVSLCITISITTLPVSETSPFNTIIIFFSGPMNHWPVIFPPAIVPSARKQR